MFEMKKFGAYLSRLRKERDLTQSMIADKLNVTRQAVSNWERGDSFPDISLLIEISKIFNISVDKIVNGEGEESEIISHVAKGKPDEVAEQIKKGKISIESVINTAPLLKASTLEVISEGMSELGIDIENIVKLAEYIDQMTLSRVMGRASFNNINEEVLERLIPFMDKKAVGELFIKILNKELSPSLLMVMLQYEHLPKSIIEHAIIDGILEEEY